MPLPLRGLTARHFRDDAGGTVKAGSQAKAFRVFMTTDFSRKRRVTAEIWSAFSLFRLAAFATVLLLNGLAPFRPYFPQLESKDPITAYNPAIRLGILQEALTILQWIRLTRFLRDTACSRISSASSTNANLWSRFIGSEKGMPLFLPRVQPRALRPCIFFQSV